MSESRAPNNTDIYQIHFRVVPQNLVVRRVPRQMLIEGSEFVGVQCVVGPWQASNSAVDSDPYYRLICDRSRKSRETTKITMRPPKIHLPYSPALTKMDAAKNPAIKIKIKTSQREANNTPFADPAQPVERDSMLLCTVLFIITIVGGVYEVYRRV